MDQERNPHRKLSVRSASARWSRSYQTFQAALRAKGGVFGNAFFEMK